MKPDDKLAALIAVTQTKTYPTEPPNGYYTSNDFASAAGLGASQARKVLSEHHASGEVDMVKVKVGSHIVNYYGVKDAAKARKAR